MLYPKFRMLYSTIFYIFLYNILDDQWTWTSFFRHQWVNVCQVSVHWISSWSQLIHWYSSLTFEYIIDAFVTMITKQTPRWTEIRRRGVPCRNMTARSKSLQGLRSQKRIVALYGTFQQVKESLKSALPYRRREIWPRSDRETPKVKSWPIDVYIICTVTVRILYILCIEICATGWSSSTAPRR